MTRIVAEAPSQDRPLIPAGAYTLTLRAIKEVDVEDRWHPEEDGTLPTVKKLVWEFEADKTDNDTGKPYEHSVWTGLYYGNEKANLTTLLDQIAPDIDPTIKKQGIDVEQFIGRTFRARIQRTKNDAGKEYAKLTMLDPIGESPRFDPDEVPT